VGNKQLHDGAQDLIVDVVEGANVDVAIGQPLDHQQQVLGRLLEEGGRTGGRDELDPERVQPGRERREAVLVAHRNEGSFDLHPLTSPAVHRRGSCPPGTA